MAARTHLLIAVAVGVAVGLLVGLLGPAVLGPLSGWDAAGLTYLLLVWRAIWPMDGAATKSHAVREDPSRAASHAFVLVAALASLVAVILLLAASSSSSKGADIGVALGSVAVSWTVVHTLYTLDYARLYYSGADGGIKFDGDEDPGYTDFAYVAFTIGMTFQISDTDISLREIRRTALKHAWVSYVFGAVILASAINLVSQLTSS